MGTIWQVIEIPKYEIPENDFRPIMWIVDSGCTTHITPQPNVFTTYTELQTGAIQLRTAIEETIDASGYGSIQFGHIKVENVYHIPTLHFSLLSVS